MDAYEKYVTDRGGKRVIRKILIANNGIAAVKAIRSIRRWSYEEFADERLVSFTVMATPEDVAANAEFVRLADTLVSVPGGSNNKNYANVDLIADIAERFHCDAVWAGWGHASENPKLPRTLKRMGIAFMGPGADAMYALGDKVASTILAQSAQVPTVSWSGDGLRVRYQEQMCVPDDIFRKACVEDEANAVSVSSRIGYPLMIKASEGGGGKGIRTVRNEAGVPDAYRQVCSEVPGSPVFIMRMIQNARHLEVQVVADEYGEALALYGRDCSVQRRHQKIIEEGPVIAAAPEVWKKLEQAAVRLAREVGYVGAGTVEYLYTGDEDGGQFYFLELNPRLQVEHPVTEWITNINLPALQLQIAMGIPLGQTRDVLSLFCLPEEKRGVSLANFEPRPPRGHVIACRVTAENPDEGFQPTSGGIQELTFRNTPNVWGYFSVGASGGVHEFSDSQFGHLFAWGEDREASRRAMVLALKELSIRGDIRTTVEYLVRLLELDDFRENRITTTWLDMLIAQRIETRKPESAVAVVCAALCWARAFFEGEEKKTIEALERGQPPSLSPSLIGTSLELIYEDVKYSMKLSRAAPTVFRVRMNGSSLLGTVRPLSDGGNIVLLDGKSHVAYVREEGGGLLMVLDGMTCLFPREYDPTTLCTTVNGKLVRFLVQDGAHVDKDTAFAELEVMKMYLSLTTPEAGRLQLVMSEGSVVSVGDVLARLELEDPSKVRRTIKFEDRLPEMSMPEELGSKPHQRFRAAVRELRLLLAGYDADGDAVQSFVELADDPNVLKGELQEALSEGAGRIPTALCSELEAALNSMEKNGAIGTEDVYKTTAKLIQILEDKGIKADETPAGNTRMVLERYNHSGGLKATVISELLEQYVIATEKPFSLGKREDEVLFDLREAYRNDFRKVVDIVISHMHLARKTDVTLALLNYISSSGLLEHERTRACCDELSKFFSPLYADVALRSRLMLAEFQRPQLKEKWDIAIAVLEEVLASDSVAARQLAIAKHEDTPELELLACFLLPAPGNLLKAAERERRILKDRPDALLIAAEVYISRAYRAYEIDNLLVERDEAKGFLRAQWMFQFMRHRAYFQQSPLEVVLGAIRPGGISSYDSADDLEKLEQTVGAQYTGKDGMGLGEGPLRFGMLAAFSSVESMSEGIDRLLEVYETESKDSPQGPVNLLTIIVRAPQFEGAASKNGNRESEASTLESTQETQISLYLTGLWRQAPQERITAVNRCGIKSITYVVAPEDEFESNPGLFTLKVRDNFTEDTIYRHIDPPMAFQLELARLVNFDIQRFNYPNRLIHIFFGENNGTKPDKSESSAKAGDKDARFFVRAVIQHAAVFSTASDALVAIPEAEKTFVEALDALELGRCDPRFRHADLNHIFLNLVKEIDVNVDDVDAICRRLFLRYAQRCWKLRVFTVEVRVAGALRSHHGAAPLRFLLYNPTGHSLRVEGYKEELDSLTSTPILKSLRSDRKEYGHLHDRPALEPYQIMDRLRRKRVVAQTLETTYVYDFQHIFSRALQERWKLYSQSRLRGGFRRDKVPAKHLKVVELVLDEEGVLKPMERPTGLNDHGIVVWRYTLYTPEFPGGRDVIIIANDITFMSGSFGPKEDAAFERASRLAREEGIPRIYIAANSGARIGIADEIRKEFNVRWVNEEDPTKGFTDLYLDKDDLSKFAETARFDENGNLTDVIGASEGLCVENLMGSALIARETSIAYNETFTLTYVTARSVGIGAYLVRLGQRVIQRESNAPIILTGFNALNKVLGRSVYASNEQLGGVKIMSPNGVTHQVVKDDVEGVRSILDWLSFVPSSKNGRLPIVEPLDPIDRGVTYSPSRGMPYDPRLLICGNGVETGIFDKGSWIETVSGWAKTVVTGRARLGGIPLGIIAVEARTVEKTSPADPASPETRERVEQQAGQVWFPDSSHKTAQAILDMNREGLPLFVVANWRGFSGGMRDMFDEVLKFGSLIVDALSEYKQPVFVYIPPGGELRGGAWVVVDTNINPEMIEMYADGSSRGGVLEPEGTVEVKYRRRDLFKTMQRLDPKLKELHARLGSENDGKESSSYSVPNENLRQSIRDAIAAREAELLPVYKQIAIKFVDLHDTPGRMVAKKAVKKIVACTEARSFFYWRLQRRLAEQRIKKQIGDSEPSLTGREIDSLLRRWADQSGVFEGSMYDEDDQTVFQWLEDSEEQINMRVDTVREGAVATRTADMVKTSSSGVIAGLETALAQMDDEQRKEFESRLQRTLHSVGSTSTHESASKTIAGLLSRLRLYSHSSDMS
ncbi:hypothetical protein NDN08_006265 [Rhodosorus marinus]|uniref:Acetyl-CoA carboxylase n=1 Tax=Rhodosorus marinus TaxID=101924 RepID=A0AAV8UP66_9RHOD|nr:hypothetical protein NDN08_006265 [Rhodosorus marinus]